jgi:serine/threonine-protein phosphatase 5
LSNRSICNIKLENYGDAVIDATKAIEYNPAYVKAYYRRGDALLLLQKPRDALQDFRTVKKKNPSSKEAIAKVEECKKIILELEFSAAIESYVFFLL